MAAIIAVAASWAQSADMASVTDTDDQIVMAKLAYAAYGQTTDFKNFQGNPMPAWDDLGDTIQAAWIAASNAVANYLTGPPALDETRQPAPQRPSLPRQPGIPTFREQTISEPTFGMPTYYAG